MKKSLITLLALILSCLMIFAACGNKAEEKDDEKEEDETSEVSAEATTADGEVDATGEGTEATLPSVPAVTEPSAPAVKTDEDKVADYVAAYGDEIIGGFESTFSASGMTCNSTVVAEGTGIVVKVCINELDNLTAEQKSVMQNTYDQLSPMLNSSFGALKTEIPEVTYVKFEICEKDGDILATLNMDGSATEAPTTEVPSTAIGAKTYTLGSEEEGEMVIAAFIYDANGNVTEVMYGMAVEFATSESSLEEIEEIMDAQEEAFNQYKNLGANITAERVEEPEGIYYEAEIVIESELEATLIATIFGATNDGAIIKMADIESAITAEGFVEYVE